MMTKSQNWGMALFIEPGFYRGEIGMFKQRADIPSGVGVYPKRK
jgi:hypothetical protein